MTNKQRLLLFLLIMICEVVLLEFGQHIGRHYRLECSEAAEDLLCLFEDVCFDGMIYNDDANEVCIYENVESCGTSGVLERKIKKVIALDSDTHEALSHFRDAQWYHDGLFFAESIDWDGEWSGIYINASALPISLEDYVRDEFKTGYYWLSGVPVI